MPVCQRYVMLPLLVSWPTHALPDGLRMQGVACNPLNVRQGWRFSGPAGRESIALRWIGVDPANEQALDASSPAG
eukprot:gene895-biopygen6100